MSSGAVASPHEDEDPFAPLAGRRVAVVGAWDNSHRNAEHLPVIASLVRSGALIVRTNRRPRVIIRERISDVRLGVKSVGEGHFVLGRRRTVCEPSEPSWASRYAFGNLSMVLDVDGVARYPAVRTQNFSNVGPLGVVRPRYIDVSGPIDTAVYISDGPEDHGDVLARVAETTPMRSVAGQHWCGTERVQPRTVYLFDLRRRELRVLHVDQRVYRRAA